jgi:hypothetical protein
MRGWQAETKVDTPDLGEGRFLKLSTHKVDGGGLVTTATVCTKTDGGYSFVMFQDYSKAVTRSKSRCTDKNVEIQHTAALNDLEFILTDARIHYMKGEAA